MLCKNVLFLNFLNIFNISMSIMRFAVPIMLIIKMILDIYHGIIDPNDKSIKEKISKRILACVIIFLIPTIIDVFLGFIENITNMSFNYTACNYNTKNIDYYIDQRELEEKLKHEKDSSEIALKYQQTLSDLRIKIERNKIAADDTAMIIGEKYNLSDKELTNVAKVCQREQGRPEGAAAEAELMINKYILSGYSGSFYDYLFNSRNGRWWHPIKSGNYSSTKLKPEIKEAVRKVVNEGQRKYPFYINEHDCISCNDITSIKTDGKSVSKNNRSNYVRDNTQVYTVYKKNSKIKYWIFYDFPDEKSDPFGYTVDAKEKLAAIGK